MCELMSFFLLLNKKSKTSRRRWWRKIYGNEISQQIQFNFHRPASMRNQQEIIGEEKLIFRNNFQPWRDFIYTPQNVYILIDGRESESEQKKYSIGMWLCIFRLFYEQFFSLDSMILVVYFYSTKLRHECKLSDTASTHSCWTLRLEHYFKMILWMILWKRGK